MLSVFWFVQAVQAAPIEIGERLEWSVQWMGMSAGTAWAMLSSAGSTITIEAGCDTSGVVEKMYSIHDRLTSTWSPESGSHAYVTRYREGTFQQDMDMRFDPDTFLVKRTQLYGDGWKTSENRYTPVAHVEDPVSAFYRIRMSKLDVGGSISFPLFTGKKTVTLLARAVNTGVVNGQPATRVEISTGHEGDLQGRLTVMVSQDENRVPLQVIVQTRAGPVYATLTRRTLPG